MTVDARDLRVLLGVTLTHEQDNILCLHGTVRVLCNRGCYINVTMPHNGQYMVTQA